MAEQIPDITKKASARIIKELEKFDPKVSSKTTYQQAFDILMEKWDLELSLEKTADVIKSSIYKDGTITHSFEWTLKEAWNDKEYDFEWNFIYRTILEHISKTRMYKRPKVSKRELNAQLKAKAEAEKAAAKQAEKEAKAAAKAAKEQEKLEKAKKRATKKTK